MVVLLVCAALGLAACGSGPAAVPGPQTLVGVDAHDGHLLQVGSDFYLYGTAYDCGFRLSDPATPWCGFRTYSSTDLVHWVDRGPTFDPGPWQSPCGHGAFGCYRADVLRAPSGTFVLWFNDPSATSGYQVMTAPSPLGPWTLQPPPHLASRAPSYGDESLLAVGSRAWVAYTVISGAHHDLAFQALDPAWTDAVGPATMLGASLVEAPALFPAGGRYGLTYSDPACPYCSGTGTSLRFASSPLGPWSGPTSLSSTSCGGQPAFVAPIRRAGRTTLLYSSDLWDHGDLNEARARIYLAPLVARGGSFAPLSCQGAAPPPSA